MGSCLAALLAPVAAAAPAWRRSSNHLVASRIHVRWPRTRLDRPPRDSWAFRTPLLILRN